LQNTSYTVYKKKPYFENRIISKKVAGDKIRGDAPCMMCFDFQISADISDQIPVLDRGGLHSRPADRVGSSKSEKRGL